MTPPSTPAATRLSDAWPVFALPALVVPPLIAVNWPPSATFFNQAAALLGWAVWLGAIAAALPGAPRRFDRGVAALAVVLGLLALEALLGPGLTGLPGSLSLSSAGMILAALLAAGLGAAAAGAGRTTEAFGALALGLFVSGAASAAVGLIQVFAPQAADGVFIAAGSIPGLAIGNLRQPNHLMTLLLWSIVASVWLVEAGRLPRAVASVAVVLMLIVVVLTASRTGVVGALLIALWGVVDRRLTGRTRLLLIALPLLYLLAWWALSLWSQSSGAAFAAESKFSTQRATSSSRWDIYRNTVAMIRAQPWFGVGFGEFNLAWTLTPFPDRPLAFFDHTHSLPLQFAVELGLPLATLLIVLLAYALWRAFVLARRDDRVASPGRAATVLLLLAALHSLLEYPLWYAYFLLPAAMAFGIALGRPGGATAAADRLARTAWRPAVIASAGMFVLSALSLVDYGRVVSIFSPSEDAGPIADRIAAGRRSVLFSHHADYAAATTAEHPSQAMESLYAASHYLLDTRLMMAWANAYAEAGDLARARHLAQRLREFRNPDAREYFAVCDDPSERDKAYQCTPASQPLSWRDFRP